MREQLGQIYRDHRRGLFALALCITGTKSLAEDAVHEAFLRLCRSQRQPSGSLKHYVFAAVRNAAVDISRQRGNDPAHSLDFLSALSLEADSENQPDEQLAQSEQQEMLRQAILGLDPASQEAVTLKIFAGLTFDAIGEITSERPSTVATRYRRALQTLEQRLKGQL